MMIAAKYNLYIQIRIYKLTSELSNCPPDPFLYIIIPVGPWNILLGQSKTVHCPIFIGTITFRTVSNSFSADASNVRIIHVPFAAGAKRQLKSRPRSSGLAQCRHSCV